MKKLFVLSIFLFCAFTLFAQNPFSFIQGTVVNSSNGQPAANQTVYISSDSSQSPTISYFNQVVTDAGGFFADTVPAINGALVTYQVYTFDCNGSYIGSNVQVQFNVPSSVTLSVCASAAGGCQAGFYSYQDTSVSSSQFAYQFDNTSTFSSAPYLSTWNFGDGSTSTDNSPLHSYAVPGVYQVCLTIIDAIGCVDTSCQFVVVDTLGNPNGNCQANFAYVQDTTNPNAPLTFQFTNASTLANLVSIHWDFGDGSTSNQIDPVHIYNQQGNYNVCLTVTDASGCTNTFCKIVSANYIIVNPVTCHAVFYYYQDSSISSSQFAYQFINSSSGSWQAQWAWSFGDGGSSTDMEPLHAFPGPGVYNVCLTMSDTSGCFDQSCQTIVVDTANNGQCFSYFTFVVDTPATLPPFPPMGVQFSNQSAGGSSYHWDFGDGTTSNVANPPYHIYNSLNAPFYVCLTVSDSANMCSNQYCALVNWSNNSACPINVFFEQQPANQNVVSFYANFTDSTQSGVFVWSFGDGSIDSTSGNTVTHTYTQPGAIAATVTAYSANGCVSSETMTFFIPVDTGMFPGALSGSVYLGPNGGLADSSWVFLISLNIQDSTLNAVDSVFVTTYDSSAFYFYNVAPGYYYLKAFSLPGTAQAAAYMPTYYGNDLFWYQATQIAVGQATQTVQRDIYLIPGVSSGNGPGFIGGSIFQGANKVGDPMAGADAYLLNTDEKPIRRVTTNIDGAFNFDNLPFGTYILTGELLGQRINRKTIVLSAQNPSVTQDLESNKSLSAVGSDLLASIKTIIYPNPVLGDATISIELPVSAKIEITLVNNLGQTVAVESQNLNAGSQSIRLSMQNLPTGLYHARILANGQPAANIKVVKAQ